MQLLDGVRRHVQLVDVVECGGGGNDTRTEQHVGAIAPEDFAKRRLLALLLAELLEVGRLIDIAADVEADRTDEQTDGEGDTPSPRAQLIGGEQQAQQRRHAGGEHRREALGGHLPAREEAATLGVGVLDHERRGGAEFTARREALQHARDDDEERRENADLFVRRRERDHRSAEHHQADGHRERRLAARAVGVAAENDRAQRTRHERNAEGAHGEQQRRRRVMCGEEKLTDHDGEVAIDQQIVELECVADTRRADFAPRVVGFGVAGHALLLSIAGVGDRCVAAL